MVSGKEPITTRLVGLPLLDALVTTTRFDLVSVAPDVLPLLSDGATTTRCKRQEKGQEIDFNLNLSWSD